MKPEDSLRCSQEPATGPNPEPDKWVNNFPRYFPEIHSNIILQSKPGSSELSLPFVFSDQNFVCISRLFYKYMLIYIPSPFDYLR
jgi:hypothetical protein